MRTFILIVCEQNHNIHFLDKTYFSDLVLLQITFRVRAYVFAFGPVLVGPFRTLSSVITTNRFSLEKIVIFDDVMQINQFIF